MYHLETQMIKNPGSVLKSVPIDVSLFLDSNGLIRNRSLSPFYYLVMKETEELDT